MTGFDLAIVGAGPAGLAAATTARQAGLSVVVLDDQPAPGGQIWRALEARAAAGEARLFGAAYREGLAPIPRFRASGAEWRPETRVWQIEPRPDTAGWRVFASRNGQSNILETATLLLATGAQERPTPFPGWTLPGVLTVGAAQILLKTSLQIPDAPVWIAGSGPLVWLYAVQLLAAGGRIAGILHTAPPGGLRRALPHAASALLAPGKLAQGLGWMLRLRRAGVKVIDAVSELAAEGEESLNHLRYRTAGGTTGRVEASVLLVHEGLIPAIHPTSAAGCALEWNTAPLSFRPRTDSEGRSSQAGILVAGDAAGIAGAEAASARGTLAALALAHDLGRIDAAVALRRAKAAHRRLAHALYGRPLLDALYPPREETLVPADATVICRCEGLTAGEIRAAAKIGRPGPNQVKAFTRCGMGPCQGRQCGPTVSHLIAQTQEVSLGEVGFFRIRPPLRPIGLAELAALDDNA